MLDRWFTESGWARFGRAIDQLNAEAGPEIDQIAARHGVHLSGLLGLATEACWPVTKREWSRWIDTTGWKDSLIREAMRSRDEGLGGLLAQLVRFFEDLFLTLFGSDEDKEALRRKREEAQRAKLRAHIADAFQATVFANPGVQGWAEQVHRYFVEMLTNLAAIATPPDPP